ncbi:putative zinc resistance-associated protein precursor [Solidesulfovibrio fructosivorans JJ]]|uniref:Putative zinc resistance-associated protein n=1 Tax=Solidesulfovibrio fructosivorans JJ] TaxID=596151 RepID=E1JVE0_SOLFR|nr:periplasmic heavy metal sensor [Solidesulfovibrio fructosivorans]EFL51734.1 putative zinc resistance-associated protein precursor [Solidesulfovibrio fructosivorans JJ]]
MNGKKFGIILTALATLALSASLAMARPGGPAGVRGGGYGPADCPGYGGGFMTQLTPEKQAAFQKLHDDYAAKTAQLRADLGVKRAELNALAVAQNPDQAKIDALTKEIGDMQGKLLAARTTFRIQVNKEIGPMGWGGRGMGGFHHRGAGYGPCGGGF